MGYAQTVTPIQKIAAGDFAKADDIHFVGGNAAAVKAITRNAEASLGDVESIKVEGGDKNFAASLGAKMANLYEAHGKEQLAQPANDIVASGQDVKGSWVAQVASLPGGKSGGAALGA